MTDLNQPSAGGSDSTPAPQPSHMSPGAAWSEDVARWMLEGARCPVCFAVPLVGGCCTVCAADLRGPAGEKLAEVSGMAAEMLRVRQTVLATVPQVAAAPEPALAGASSVLPQGVQADPEAFPQSSAATAQSPAPTTLAPELARPAPAAPAAPAEPAASASLQSVLAVSGAGLVAIAAIVFTFFNPDLSDNGLRSAIVGLTTLAFAGGSWMLARRGLQFSAEAIGGLAVVFVGLDIWAFARWTLEGANPRWLAGLAPNLPWLLAGLATLVAAVCLAVAGKLAGVRVWSFGAAVAVTLVPPMFGFSSELNFAALLGFVAMAFVGFGAAGRLAARAPRAAMTAMTILQMIASVVAFVWALGEFGQSDDAARFFGACGIVAALALHAGFAARHQVPRLWSAAAGLLAATSLGLAAITAMHEVAVAQSDVVRSILAASQSTAFVAVATALALATMLVRLPRYVSRFAVLFGVLFTLAISLLPSLAFNAISVLDALITPLLYWSWQWLGGTGEMTFSSAGGLNPAGKWPTVITFTIVAAGAWNLSTILRRRWADKPALAHFFGVQGVLFAVVSLLTVAAYPFGWSPWYLAIPLTAATLWAVAALWSPKFRAKTTFETRAFRVAAHVLIAAVAFISWREPGAATVVGVGVLLALSVVAFATSSNRSWHVGFGYAYGLMLVAVALAQLNDLPSVELSATLRLSVVTSLGLLGALGATLFRVCEPRSWRAILIVTLLPFGLGIAQVTVERSGWTALSTGIMCALAFVLMITRRPGLGRAVRAIAAGMLVPSLSVFVVCLGAQTIPGSASPVTLPIIAVIVGAALLLAMPTRGMLERNGLTTPVARLSSLAIEVSALVTGAIAVLLALVRQAAGLGTTLTVLLILGVTAATTAKLAGRRYAWWVAGACFTGALWCVWAMAGVVLLEAYLLPPTLAAAAIAAVLTARGKPAVRLYAAWLGLAIVPVLMRYALDGTVWRGLSLLAGSLVLLAIGAWFGRSSHRTESRSGIAKLSNPTLLASMLAAVAGPVLGVRFGLGIDTLDEHGASMHGAVLFLACLAVAVVGALVMTISAGRLSVRNRWLGAPAVLALAVGVWPSIERDWFNIWAMWGVMCLGIVAVVVAAMSVVTVSVPAVPDATADRGEVESRSRIVRVADVLPPVWLLFAATFVTAIVAWSPRDLRVEWFSLPLGIGLLAAGALAAAKTRYADGSTTAVVGTRGTLSDWPNGWSGSWAHFGPGLIVTISASMLATFTDPQTWRAILVIVIALIAIIVGAARRLAAPFLLGIIVLPVENVIAFAVQIGRGIESMPWWITLAIVGAVLLTIAVTYERRAGEAETLVARLRDLR